jgi:hypothetical protein
MAANSSVVSKALRNGGLERMSAPAPLEAIRKAEVGRRHWERAVGLSRVPETSNERLLRPCYNRRSGCTARRGAG